MVAFVLEGLTMFNAMKKGADKKRVSAGKVAVMLVEHDEKMRRVWSRSNLLRTLIFSSPLFSVQMLTSLSRVSVEKPFYVYWIDDLKTGTFASCGSIPEKMHTTQGFVLGHGGHHFGGGVWVGNAIDHLQQLRVNLKWDVTEEELERFVTDGESLFFIRPDYPDLCPVYELSQFSAGLANDAGLTTETEAATDRPVTVGDLLLLLPPRGNWEFPIRIFPPNELPADRYRRFTLMT